MYTAIHTTLYQCQLDLEDLRDMTECHLNVNHRTTNCFEITTDVGRFDHISIDFRLALNQQSVDIVCDLFLSFSGILEISCFKKVWTDRHTHIQI